MQKRLSNVLRGWNARRRVWLSYLGVKKEVPNFCLKFKVFKGKKTNA